MPSIGFVGTRRGVTAAQERRLAALLARWEPGWLHHGDRTGADATVHHLARSLGWKIATHPSTIVQRRAMLAGDITHPPAEPLVAHRQIVRQCDVLLAAPATVAEVLRSGTWAAIREARRLGTTRIVVGPNGEVIESYGAPGCDDLCCPNCGTIHPDPEGAVMGWLPRRHGAADFTLDCPGCWREEIPLTLFTRVNLDTDEA